MIAPHSPCTGSGSRRTILNPRGKRRENGGMVRQNARRHFGPGWWIGLMICLVVPSAGPLRAEGPGLTPEKVESILASLHTDYRKYIGSVRYGATRLRPATLYAGLVKKGGIDPRSPEDGPLTGRGVRNDLIIYSDTFEPWRTPAWRKMITDHEYFHARHLGRGFNLPVVSFGRPGIDAHYYEALAWGYVRKRAAEGVYGEMTRKELGEIEARYREHHSGFHAFVMKQQASAWAHYGRFLPSPDEPIRSAASARQAAPAPEAGQVTR